MKEQFNNYMENKAPLGLKALFQTLDDEDGVMLQCCFEEFAKQSNPLEHLVIPKIAEKIRKAKILKETKNYTYDLGNAERLRGYIKALEELKHELSNFTV